MNKKKTLGALIVFLLLVPAAVRAQEKETGSYPDIVVMNSILGQLLKGVNGDDYSRPTVSGSYIPSYGLLFVVNQPNGIFGSGMLAERLGRATEMIDLRKLDSSMAVFDSTMKEYEISMKKFDSSMTWHDSTFARPRPILRIHPKVLIRERSEANEERLSKEIIGKLDAQVTKFLGSYADAENKLTPGQRVSVLVLMGGDSLQARYYVVSRKEISDYRAQAQSSAAFRQKVQISDLKRQNESMDIMVAIIDKSIDEGMSGDHRLLFGANTRGIYLKGIGAFFVCRLTGLPDFSELGDRPHSSKDKTAGLEKLVIKTVGTYGSSLRFLPDGESILVSLQFDSFGAGEKNVLVSLKKKDVDSYTRNEISYDTLRQRAMIIQSQ